MDWILANLKLVIIAIVLVVYALKSMRAKGEVQDDPAESSRRTLPGEQDEAEAQRTREIQEEIRRRILARQRGESMPAPAPVPEPEVIREEPMPMPVPLPPPVPTAQRMEPMEDPYAAEAAARAAQQAAMLEAQRAMEEQLRQARRIREMAAAGVPSIASGQLGGGSSERRSTVVRRGLRADLAGRASLRRAIVLREILGEPVALRRGPAGSSQR